MPRTTHQTTTKDRNQLSPRQALFLARLLARPDGNATEAAIDAGFSPKNARFQASRMRKHPLIQKALAEASAKVLEKAVIDAAWVLTELVDIYSTDISDALSDSGDVLAIRDMPKNVRKMIQSLDVEAIYEGQGGARRLIGYNKKLRLYARKDLLEQIGKHVSVNAFRENVNHTGIPSYEDQLRIVQARIDAAKAETAKAG
jgi:phage terminase small subunit